MKYIFVIALFFLLVGCFEDDHTPPKEEPKLEVKGHIMTLLLEKGGVYYLTTQQVDSVGDPIEMPDGFNVQSVVYTGDVIR